MLNSARVLHLLFSTPSKFRLIGRRDVPLSMRPYVIPSNYLFFFTPSDFRLKGYHVIPSYLFCFTLSKFRLRGCRDAHRMWFEERLQRCRRPHESEVR